MPAIKQILIGDVVTALWVMTIYLVIFIWLPIKAATSGHKQLNTYEKVALGLRSTLVIIVGVIILSYLHILNWLALTLVYACYLIFNYSQTRNWGIKDYQQIIQNRMINLIDILDRGFDYTELLKSLNQTYHHSQQQFNKYITNIIKHQGIFLLIIITISLGLTILLRWEYPLQELRFSHSDRYGVLLTTRQILTGNYPHTNSLPIFSALAAGISLLGSIDAMETIRFLGSVLGAIMVLSVGYLIYILIDAISGAVAMFSLGGYLFTTQVNLSEKLPDPIVAIINSLNSSLIRQWTGNEIELGVSCFLLGLGYYLSADNQHRRTITFKVNIILITILVIICFPSLLFLIAIALFASLGGKKLVLGAITLSWIVLAIFAAISEGQIIWTQSFLVTLPIPLSFITAIIFRVCANFVNFFVSQGEALCLALILSLAFNFLLPFSPPIVYVEYDMAARKSLELRKLFSPHTWTLVAPVEQLAQVYGAGGYQDLALFVEKYAPQVNKSEFNFPLNEQHLFILVEKIPFITFKNEPTFNDDNLNILSDRTYRFYRSSAGRASLEYEALQMCQAYSQTHPNSEIYYEDRELRIYHFLQIGDRS